MSLRDLLKPSVRVSSSSVAQKSNKYVNEVKSLGRVVAMESPGLMVDVKPNKELPVSGKDYNLLITAILTKYPHYTFRCKVKSGEMNLVRYWFIDTSRVVNGVHPTIVMRYKDMQDELTCAMLGKVRLYLQGCEEDEEFVPKINSTELA